MCIGGPNPSRLNVIVFNMIPSETSVSWSYLEMTYLTSEETYMTEKYLFLLRNADLFPESLATH